MEDLERKYRENSLTPAELLELREKINSSGDGELERRMLDAWIETDGKDVESKQIRRIKRRIDIANRKRVYPLLYYAGIAAGILLPILIASTLYLYHENNRIYDQSITISTGKGERAGITLPDGSKVTLNSMSELCYSVAEYNKEARHIDFSGEGYFDVRHSPEAPFVINSRNLKVEVLGTTFNLLARTEGETSELSLEKGRVLLVSLQRGDSVVLNANQKAILDQNTGNITVITSNTIDMASGWTRGELIYRNTKLSEVIRDIEDNYNISIKINDEECLENTFTGTLSTHDLNEALEIIELSYNLKARIDHKNVLLVRQ